MAFKDDLNLLHKNIKEIIDLVKGEDLSLAKEK
jgi:hypothetical protein